MLLPTVNLLYTGSARNSCWSLGAELRHDPAQVRMSD
jgi:hypothetical protein